MNEFKILNGELIKYEGSQEHVVIPEEVDTIRDFAFYECLHLKSIQIPETVKMIGNFCFYGCDELIEITIPKSVTYLGDGALSYCRKLKKVTIQGPIQSIKKSMFYRSVLLEEVHLPNTIQTIGRSAFSYCEKLGHINLPEGLEVIDNSAFESCTSLQTLTMNKHLKQIGEKAFYDCHNLKFVQMNEELESIQGLAFQTLGQITFISNDHFPLHPGMFEHQWNIFANNVNDKNYQFYKSYLPKVKLNEWKPYARIILLVNYLETYDRYFSVDKTKYNEACLTYKDELLPYLIKEQRWDGFYTLFKEAILPMNELDRYLDLIHERELRAKIMNLKNQTPSTTSLEDALDDLF